MLIRLDAADRLVRVIDDRGTVSAAEAARVLLALARAPTSLAEEILDSVVRQDARLRRHGEEVVLAPAPLVDVPIERARFAVLDVETSGLSASSARLTEIGVVVLDAGRVVAEFDMTIGGPTDTEDALRQLRRLAGGAVVAGHNVGFDLAFLDRALRSTGARMATPTVDTLPLARRLLRGRIEGASLAALAEFFGVPSAPCHRALPDARATAEVLLALLELAKERGARTVGDLCGLARTLARREARIHAGRR